MTDRRTEKCDSRDVANYTLAESARWLGLVPNTLRVWLVGQNYRTKAAVKRMLPVVLPAAIRPLGLSFWNLVECSVLAALRRTHNVSLPKVRRALGHVGREFDKARPLIEQEFLTDGVALFVDRYGKLIEASKSGQMAMCDLLAKSLTRIETDEQGLAVRFFPWTHRPDEPKVVSIDPRISFGRPVLTSTGITVEVLLGRFWAGDTIDHLARDYRVEPDRIEALIRWSGGATAA